MINMDLGRPNRASRNDELDADLYRISIDINPDEEYIEECEEIIEKAVDLRDWIILRRYFGSSAHLIFKSERVREQFLRKLR